MPDSGAFFKFGMVEINFDRAEVRRDDEIDFLKRI